jgi:hypothetical protein
VIAIATLPIEAVIDRLAHDRAFRVSYCNDPEGALRAYNLTPDEIRAIKTCDDGLLASVKGDKWDALIRALCGTDPGP